MSRNSKGQFQSLHINLSFFILDALVIMNDFGSHPDTCSNGKGCNGFHPASRLQLTQWIHFRCQLGNLWRRSAESC